MPGESGLVLSFDVGGGTALGARSEYTPRGRFESELTVGYELPYGIRPEFGLVLGVAPSWHGGLRPGVHVELPELPFYLRAAAEWSSIDGVGAWRWLLGGAGGELRLTGLLSGFAELDVGLPLKADSGLAVLLRAGVAFRL